MIFFLVYKLVRRKYYFGLVFLSGIIIFYWYTYGEAEVEIKYYQILNEGCKIPFLEVYDDNKRVNSIFENDTNGYVPCGEFTFLLNNSSHIWVEKKYVEEFHVIYESIDCCYQSFKQAEVDDLSTPERAGTVQYQPFQNFNDSVKVFGEFAKVSCQFEFQNYTKSNYSQFFIFTPVKNSKYLITADWTEFQQKIDYNVPPCYNVIILGFSGMSRLNFYRTMGGTFDHLYAKHSVEMQGYHKAGGFEFVNIMPLILGLNETEINRSCWPYKSAHSDNCSFIWNLFKNADYNTAFGDDCSYSNDFNLQRHSFIENPTDYYMCPFVTEATTENHQKNIKCKICMGPRYFYQVLLDYIENLTKTLKDSKLFGLFWETCMSHENNAYLLEIMDKNYLDLIMRMEQSGYLSNTILIITSDSGLQQGKTRFSMRGRLEERLPVMQILLPPSFKEKYQLAYKNLVANRYRLTTPFDLYLTLKDLVNLSTIEDSNIKRRSIKAYSRHRGISLFLDIPSNRTCADVNLTDDECVCDNIMARNIKVNSTIARHSAVFLIEHVNSLLREYHDKCSQLRLVKIQQTTAFKINAIKHYDVVLVLRPDMEQDDVRHYLEIKSTLSLGNRKEWKLVGDVHRTNAIYGKNKCLNDKIERKYRDICYCRELIFNKII